MLEWLHSAKEGDVHFLPRGLYHPGLLHSFGNAPSTRHILARGTTHVAVGFLDLGSLSCADVRDDQGPAGCNGEAPLLWIGYDCSAYSIAKTSLSWSLNADAHGYHAFSFTVVGSYSQ